MDNNVQTPQEENIETPQEEVIETPKEEVKDRTAEQFEKLKEHNKELAEERDQYKNLFEGLRPQEVPQEVAQTYQEPINQAPSAQNFQNLDQNQVNQAFAGMIDENGYLDGNKLMNTLQTLDQRAKQAEETAKKVQEQARQEQINKRDREEKAAIAEVYTKFPQMDPNNVDGVEVEGELVKFDPKMWQYVKNELEATARRGVMPSESDYMNTTQKVYNDLYGERQMNKKVEAKKIENQKLQINATRPRSTINVGYYENDEEDSIVKDVRAGKRGAVGALLRKRGL
jgi:hypothetical protein